MFTSEKHESQHTAIVKVRKDVSLTTDVCVLVNMMCVCTSVNVSVMYEVCMCVCVYTHTHIFTHNFTHNFTVTGITGWTYTIPVTVCKITWGLATSTISKLNSYSDEQALSSLDLDLAHCYTPEEILVASTKAKVTWSHSEVSPIRRRKGPVKCAVP